MTCKVTLLAGGVGGAKMAEGFAALDDVSLTIIGNVADDDEFHGLWVSPDIDTVMYTLAGLINRDQGWGVADEGLRGLSVLQKLGQETWMTLGDRDFGLHIYRTMRRRSGDRPTEIAADIARAFGVGAQIVLPTDDIVQTRVETANGWMSFQEYFVREQCKPDVTALEYSGISAARATPEACAALTEADLIVIAPSNPLVSIRPILSIPGLAEALAGASAPVVAVSPLIGGKVVKGPADRMMRSLGHRSDVVGIAAMYAGVADVLVIDPVDASLADDVRGHVADCATMPILMRSLKDKATLARALTALPAKRDRAGQAA